MDKLNRKLKGSTLVEAITSMTLVLLITGLVFTFFLNVSTQGVKSLELEAFLSSQRIIDEITNNHSFLDEKWSEKHLNISKKVLLLNQENQSFLINLEFTDIKNRHVLSYKTILRNQLENN